MFNQLQQHGMAGWACAAVSLLQIISVSPHISFYGFSRKPERAD
jgi:hypothetical protein